MEKLCKIRDIQRAVAAFERLFEKNYGICLNEGMVLCLLYKASPLSSGKIGKLLGLSLSNTSKIIVSMEKKGLVKRVMGTNDKRQMYFLLTTEGEKLILSVRNDDIEVSELLKGCFCEA
ncbi:MAG: MarR family transcriptional regulator [Prevotellaceae bacterium]|jgi:DNA-binding MarR family transcriptional regulator|nr:MarR family transcriptional regulator [Prevotellaceae bacterium]